MCTGLFFLRDQGFPLFFSMLHVRGVGCKYCSALIISGSAYKRPVFVLSRHLIRDIRKHLVCLSADIFSVDVLSDGVFLFSQERFDFGEILDEFFNVACIHFVWIGKI